MVNREDTGQMIRYSKICLFLLFIIIAYSIPSHAAAKSQWVIEAESADVQHAPSIIVTQDATASGGNVISVPVDGIPAWNAAWFALPPDLTPGRYRLTAYLSMENAADIGKAWRIDIRNGDALLAHGVAYGLYLHGKGYQPFSINFDVADSKVRPAVYMRWAGQEGNPKLKLDRFVLDRAGDLPRLRVTRVWPDKVRYKTSQDGTINVTVQNPTQIKQHAMLELQLQHDLEPSQVLESKNIDIDAGASQELKFTLKHQNGVFGYAVRARLIVEGKEIDNAEEFFCVHDNPWAVATGARDDEVPDYYTPWNIMFYGIGVTDSEIEECALHARLEYTTCTEFFGWSPGEAFGLAPKDPVWIRGNGGDILRSKREIQRGVTALHDQGIGCISYIAFQAMGEDALRLIGLHPEWFIYSRDNGDHLEFYDIRQQEAQRKFWKDFDKNKYHTDGDPDSQAFSRTPDGWNKYKDYWLTRTNEVNKLSSIGFFIPNYSLPEVVDYCADQVIQSTKMFGWDGLRWDCGNLNTGPIWGPFRPYIDFNGREIAKSPDEMTQQTTANIDRLRNRIRKSFPSFVFGTNYGSVMETSQYPKLTAKLCSDGDWILDEYSYLYNTPESPYHWWDKYYAVMSDQGDHITSLGGYYNPFAFNRTGGKYPVDRLYETIFRLIGKGHPSVIYYNSSIPAGNYAQFSVRFGRFLFDTNLHRVNQPESIVNVTSSSPLWWRKSVQRLKQGSDEYLIVHLVNPPIAKEAETDPSSKLNPPVTGTKVEVKAPIGKKTVTAWALTAELWKTGDTPRTQAVPLKVEVNGDKMQVTVPEVLYWKSVVFKFQDH